MVGVGAGARPGARAGTGARPGVGWRFQFRPSPGSAEFNPRLAKKGEVEDLWLFKNMTVQKHAIYIILTPNGHKNQLYGAYRKLPNIGHL